MLSCEFKIVLASTSPRRIDILRQAGIRFKAVNPKVEENSVHPDPRQRVMENALSKAKSVSGQIEARLILAADTVVFINGEILGKPSSVIDAEEMIKTLTGRVHKVYTGVALIDKTLNRTLVNFEETLVYFKNMTNCEINEWVLSGDVLDKAGSYSVQGMGSFYVDRFVGSYYNVLGLPLSLVKDMLYELKIELKELF